MPDSTIPNVPDKLPKNVKVEQVEVSWEAPARPYRKRNREYYTTIGSIVFLLAVILLLLKEFLLIGVILSIAFLSYTLGSVPPGNIIHQITTKGIRTEDRLYEWEQLRLFYVDTQFNTEVLVILTKLPLPSQLRLVIEPQKRSKILESLGERLELQKPDDSFVDRASSWLQKKVPLENS